ncbi:hypothetical protein SBF1_1880005 [Candidatus Desulfosporosinus infrequens]|uniref:Uncharacterized protein n=1 Tax=Candidatus Desulfosporosinus infrequens TaxID=2043169 RepID=A0A2U3KDU9_9FIRM|nr:hypothetical protein SBF1_1880005 [Candidatus Desulfosporosinus infrequens]
METDATRDQSFNLPSGTNCYYAQAVEEATTFIGPDFILFERKVAGVAHPWCTLFTMLVCLRPSRALGESRRGKVSQTGE